MIYRLWGVVTRQDLGDLHRAGHTLERSFTVIPNRLADFSEMSNLDDGYYAMLALVEKRVKETFPNSFRTALFVKTPLQFGLARMFKTLNHNAQIDVQIFADRAEAVGWLGAVAAEKAVI